MLCVACITNSLCLTAKHLEFHKRAPGGEFIHASGGFKETRAFIFTYQLGVPGKERQRCSSSIKEKQNSRNVSEWICGLLSLRWYSNNINCPVGWTTVTLQLIPSHGLIYPALPCLFASFHSLLGNRLSATVSFYSVSTNRLDEGWSGRVVQLGGLQ